jgi:hypothetical protein
MQHNGINARALKLNNLAAQANSILEAVLRGDHEQSARHLFEVLGEDLYGRINGGVSIIHWCGPRTKELLLSLRTTDSVVQAVGGEGSVGAVFSSRSMGML